MEGQARNRNHLKWKVRSETGTVNPLLSDNDPVGIDFIFQLKHNDIDALGLIGDIDGSA
jgi:hypothetical protein